MCLNLNHRSDWLPVIVSKHRWVANSAAPDQMLRYAAFDLIYTVCSGLSVIVFKVFKIFTVILCDYSPSARAI